MEAGAMLGAVSWGYLGFELPAVLHPALHGIVAQLPYQAAHLDFFFLSSFCTVSGFIPLSL